ncbi:MAG TPA: BrnA antitoxin family protein [Stellaceae bacterium]|nr:BrnA antitoxin family protein [Stellaceae bacterium]
MHENKERITRVTLEDAKRLKDETDYARLDAMTDDDIARAVAEDPDAAPLDIDWSKARLVLPPGKENITLRIDRDVLAWFRATGKGFHTRMNAVLRAYMEAHPPGSR